MSNKRTLRFRGIDDFNRPVFKCIEGGYFMGSLNKLYPYDTTEEEVVEYFRNKTDELVYFSESYNCEPDGTPMKKELEFIL